MAQTSDTAAHSTPPDNPTLPQHIAIIMDGNNRWLKQKKGGAGLLGSGLAGHRAGAENARSIIRLCAERKISYLTLFAFSSENWRRPSSEVSGLMDLFARFLQRKEINQLDENNIRLRFIGARERFSARLQKLMLDAEQRTADNTGLCVLIAADYGGRWDIANAAKALAIKVAAGTLDPALIDEAMLHQETAASDIPEPDLCIRTGGECRVSNFLLWQLAYAELYFTETYWPDFDAKEFDRALADFASRQRRFGRISEQVEAELVKVR